MSNPYFSFKQFTVFHHKCAMKVGIDGVLLGAWVDVSNAKNVLDVGTGSGLIALMLAQRSDAEITGIDIEPNAVIQAAENVNDSPWKDRINIVQISLKDFAEKSPKKYDLIVSNPPYFVDSLKNPDDNRALARHTDSLPHTDLLLYSNILLSPQGKLAVILPLNQGLEIIENAEKLNMYCNKIVYIYPKPSVAIKRILLEFGQEKNIQQINSIFIETSQRHEYSPEFTALVKDFYLKL